MFLLREGSHKTDTPFFMSLPENTDDPKANQLIFFPEIGVARWFFESGVAEKGLIHWVYDTFIQPDKNFLDIGAHVGTYALICAKKAKHTYAFECSPTTFCYLAANIALQGLEEKVSPYPFALGDDDKTMDYIIRSKDGGGNGVKHLAATDEACKKLPVLMRRLDSFGLKDIGFIKIDVEGFEKEVLLGALETLKANNYPKILFESWGDWKEREGVPARAIREDLFRFLESLKYKIIPISGASDMYLASFSGSVE
jgi:FkbM family methyltransferase